MEKVIGLRIDVDTARGYKYGVFPLLDLLRKYNIKASFFITTGDDSSLKAIPRFFYESGFLRRVYRLKGSLCYKLFSVSRFTFEECINQIKEDGHELGLHGYRHFDWQLHLSDWSARRINNEMNLAIENFELLIGSYPHSFASPGWVTKKEVFLAEEKFHFDYCSDARGMFPFYPKVDSRWLKTLQIPITLPTLDEFISLGKPEGLIGINVKKGDVYCAHAEFDGMRYIEIFETFLEKNLRKGYRFIPLFEIKRNVVDAPTSGITYKTIPGRTNVITLQKTANSK